MKILHINQHLAPKGGVETYLFATLPLLESVDVESVWLYEKGDPLLWERSHVDPVIGSVSSRENTSGFSGFLHKEAPEVIHIHNIWNVELIRIAQGVAPTVLTNHDYRWLCPANTFFYKRSRDICQKGCGDSGCFPTTVHKHCMTLRPDFVFSFYQRVQQMRSLHGGFAHVIAPSPVAQRRLIAAGWDENKIDVLPYFCPLPPRQSPRPFPKHPTITFIGRLAPNKGQEYFIEALGLLPKEWRGIIVSNVDNKTGENLKQLAAKLNCQSRVQFHPWASRDEVVQILDKTTILVFPSLWEETLGIVALEALSRGVPVVATDITGISHWLEGQSFGRTVPPKDARRIASAVQELAASDDALMAAGREGIRMIREQFSPEQHVQHLLRIYQEVVQ